MLLKYILNFLKMFYYHEYPSQKKETSYAYARPFTPTCKRPFKGVRKV